jgi:hypothetical protein
VDLGRNDPLRPCPLRHGDSDFEGELRVRMLAGVKVDQWRSRRHASLGPGSTLLP